MYPNEKTNFISQGFLKNFGGRKKLADIKLNEKLDKGANCNIFISGVIISKLIRLNIKCL